MTHTLVIYTDYAAQQSSLFLVPDAHPQVPQQVRQAIQQLDGQVWGKTAIVDPVRRMLARTLYRATRSSGPASRSTHGRCLCRFRLSSRQVRNLDRTAIRTVVVTGTLRGE